MKNKTQEWYVLKGENKYGPFTYLELVKMLQDKSLFEHDFVWYKGMQHWQRIAELKDFHPDTIQNLHQSEDFKASDVFYRRRHQRASYGASLLVHNNKQVWKAESLEISAGGAALVLDHKDFQLGQILFLHFKPGDGVPPFNAICSIVSKKKLDKNINVQYGVKFTSITYSVQQSINEYTRRSVA